MAKLKRINWARVAAYAVYYIFGTAALLAAFWLFCLLISVILRLAGVGGPVTLL